MSDKKTIVGKILAAIFDLFKSKYPSFIKKTYDKIPNEIKSEIILFIKIAENINDVLQSKTVDVITDLIPGDLDDKLADWLRFVLPVVIDKAKEYTGADKAILAATLTCIRLDTTLDQALITSQVVYRENRPI